jgi:hypothetical protein
MTNGKVNRLERQLENNSSKKISLEKKALRDSWKKES